MIKKQICNACNTIYTNKTYIFTCPICRSKNIKHK